MHQFGWLSKKEVGGGGGGRGEGGNLLNLLQKEGVLKRGGSSLRKGGSNPGGSYAILIKVAMV